MYSGVSTSTFQKFITSQQLSTTGLQNIGPAVTTLAAVEGLDAHRLAVVYRLDAIAKNAAQ
jgi:phosphoribosyl-ATP pyrophosphohydrolase / phosphoribosyl-AMP cyclohydrolase / histidinol dehydrogenase